MLISNHLVGARALSLSVFLSMTHAYIVSLSPSLNHSHVLFLSLSLSLSFSLSFLSLTFSLSQMRATSRYRNKKRIMETHAHSPRTSHSLRLHFRHKSEPPRLYLSRSLPSHAQQYLPVAAVPHRPRGTWHLQPRTPGRASLGVHHFCGCTSTTVNVAAPTLTTSGGFGCSIPFSSFSRIGPR